MERLILGRLIVCKCKPCPVEYYGGDKINNTTRSIESELITGDPREA